MIRLMATLQPAFQPTLQFLLKQLHANSKPSKATSRHPSAMKPTRNSSSSTVSLEEAPVNERSCAAQRRLRRVLAPFEHRCGRWKSLSVATESLSAAREERGGWERPGVPGATRDNMPLIGFCTAGGTHAEAGNPSQSTIPSGNGTRLRQDRASSHRDRYTREQFHVRCGVSLFMRPFPKAHLMTNLTFSTRFSEPHSCGFSDFLFDQLRVFIVECTLSPSRGDRHHAFDLWSFPYRDFPGNDRSHPFRFITVSRAPQIRARFFRVRAMLAGLVHF